MLPVTQVSWLSVFSVAFLALIAKCVLQSLYNNRRHQRLAKELGCYTHGPRYPCRDPFWGLDYMYENARRILAFEFAQGVRERFQQYGSTYSSPMGFQNIVHTIDPSNLEAVMKTNFDDYIVLPDRSKLVSVLLGPGIFTHNGSGWRKSRSLVHWSISNLNISTTLLELQANALVTKLRAQSLARPNQLLDFGAVATEYTFNIAAGLMFDSLPQDGLPTETSQFATDFANVGRTGQALTIFIFMNTHVVFWNRIAPAQRRLFNFVDACARRALFLPQKPGRKHDSIVEGLATQTTDVERIRGETLNLFLAGHDTVRIAFTEQFWHLARNPAAWASLRREVKTKLDGRVPTLSELREMPYLRSVINEAARLNPTLSVHGRKAIKDTVLPHGGGPTGSDPLLIPKGTYIAYSNYALHRQPSVFGPDVDAFRPERWDSISPSKFSYLSFGAGPRFCPGKEMGWTIVAYATVRLAQEFEGLRGDGRPWQEAASFSFYNRNGCWMSMKPEQHATATAQ